MLLNSLAFHECSSIQRRRRYHTDCPAPFRLNKITLRDICGQTASTGLYQIHNCIQPDKPDEWGEINAQDSSKREHELDRPNLKRLERSQVTQFSYSRKITCAQIARVVNTAKIVQDHLHHSLRSKLQGVKNTEIDRCAVKKK